MSNSNPFQSGSIPEGSWESQPQTESTLHDSTYLLARTKPWVRFIAVLGIVMSLFAVGSAVLTASTFARMPGGPPGFLTGMMVVQVGFMILICLLFYFVPSVLLWHYGTRIADHLREKSSTSFVAALTAQKSFWKYLGIVALVVMVLYGLMLAAMFSFIMLGAMR